MVAYDVCETVEEIGGSDSIHYALSRWAALVRFCEDGRVEIDNNAAERALRTVAIGRKNYLFAGADSGGERAAAMYSLIGSGKLNDLDPGAYLHYVLGRIADHPINRISELLPWNVALSAASTACLRVDLWDACCRCANRSAGYRSIPPLWNRPLTSLNVVGISTVQGWRNLPLL